MRGRARFNPTRYRRARLLAAERRVEYLEWERLRLERLLGRALEVACGGTSATPAALLLTLCELEGTNPARAAMFEGRR